jgi:hypothetical protein
VSLPAIFISYRIADTLAQAGHLNDSLANIFGQEKVFYDKDSLQGGDKWPDKLAETVRKAQVVLVLIGDRKEWLGVGDEGRRIDEPDDWVRREVETALSDTQKLVIPILFNGAQLPTETGLPESLRPLLHCQQQQIRDAHWKNDLLPLVNILREHLEHSIDNSSTDTRQKSPPQDQGFHAYTCDRDEQFGRFEELRAAFQPGSLHFL